MTKQDLPSSVASVELDASALTDYIAVAFDKPLVLGSNTEEGPLGILHLCPNRDQSLPISSPLGIKGKG